MTKHLSFSFFSFSCELVYALLVFPVRADSLYKIVPTMRCVERRCVRPVHRTRPGLVVRLLPCLLRRVKVPSRVRQPREATPVVEPAVAAAAAAAQRRR